jgi:hypothetical protein
MAGLPDADGTGDGETAEGTADTAAEGLGDATGVDGTALPDGSPVEPGAVETGPTVEDDRSPAAQPARTSAVTARMDSHGRADAGGGFARMPES